MLDKDVVVGVGATVSARAYSGTNWELDLDDGSGGVCFNADWFEQRSWPITGMLSVNSLYTPESLQVREAWAGDFSGFCDPKTHPEFKGWCGGQGSHKLGCPTRKT